MRTIRNPDGSTSRILETVDDHIVIEIERGAVDTPELRNFIKETTEWDKEYVFHGWDADRALTVRSRK
jgi:hypothetical protein